MFTTKAVDRTPGTARRMLERQLGDVARALVVHHDGDHIVFDAVNRKVFTSFSAQGVDLADVPTAVLSALVIRGSDVAALIDDALVYQVRMIHTRCAESNEEGVRQVMAAAMAREPPASSPMRVRTAVAPFVPSSQKRIVR